LYLRERPASDLVRRLRETILSDEMLLKVAPLVHERIDKLEDFIDHTSFFFNGDVVYDLQASQAMVQKGKTATEIVAALEAVVESIDAVAHLEHESLEAKIRDIGEKLGLKTKELFMPLRVAITGRQATPPLFETMVVLGKELCRRRLRNAISHLKTLPAQS